MHAVVFTTSNDAHQMIVRMLSPLYAVCEFRTGDAPTKRDAAIRKFQAGLKQQQQQISSGSSSSSSSGKKKTGKGGAAPKATVFVVTMKAGAVGITLTAASRCYLMEPCLDVSRSVSHTIRCLLAFSLALAFFSSHCCLMSLATPGNRPLSGVFDLTNVLMTNA